MRVTHVRHAHRPDLGVGRVKHAYTGKPPVMEVVWEKKALNGKPLWGHYRLADLTRADNPK